MDKKKIQKLFAILPMLIVMFVFLAMPNEVSAAEQTKFETQFVNDFRHVKKNVKRYESWSGYKRVSDNLVTGKAGGSITSNRSVTFSTNVSGDISGLGISTSGSISSSIGYTLNAGANKRVYMGYRVRYRVEEGYNCIVDVATGRTISKKKYVVKRPIYGEYKLINY